MSVRSHRLADDFFVPDDGCTIHEVRAGILEDSGWYNGGVITVTIRDHNRTGGPQNGDEGIVTEVTVPFVAVATGDQYFGRSAFEYVIEDLNIELPPSVYGRYWLGLRCPNGQGTGGSGWATSTGGEDGIGSDVGWLSEASGDSFRRRETGWHYTFLINLRGTTGACCDSAGTCTDDVVREACDGRFRLGQGCAEMDVPCGWGACCTAKGGCEDFVRREACDGLFVDGTLCEDVRPSCAIRGACCMPGGACTADLTHKECRGRFLLGRRCEQVDPPCDALGACCNARGECQDGVMREDCARRFVPVTSCANLNPPCRNITGPCFPDAAPFDGHPLFGNPEYAIYGDTPAFLVAMTLNDFDGDGDTDVATAFGGENEPFGVSVQFNSGDGVFTSNRILDVGTYPRCVTSGDLNGDNHADLVVTNAESDTVSVVLGSGGGTFRPRTAYPTGIDPRSVVIGDINGDRLPDLAVCNAGTNDVSILLGRGDGTFAGSGAYPVGALLSDVETGGPYMAIGDLDGDDDLDLVTPIVGAVSVLLNRGDATFEPFVAYPTRRGYPWAVVIADLNGDLIPDLAVANSDGGPDGDLSIMMGNGDGTFQDAVVYDMHYHPASGVWLRPVSLTAYDLDDDGDLDLVVGFSSWGEDKLLVLLNPGDGSFAHYDVYATEELPIAVAVGHLNGDVHADIVVAAVKTIVLLGNGDGSFMAEQDIPQTYGLRDETWHNTTSLAAGDLNSDGYPDLALTNRIAENGGPSNVVVLLNGGDGTFQEPSTYIVGRPEEENTQSLVVRLGDLDGDGDLDLAVMSQGSPRGDCREPTGSLSVLFNRGDGSFDAPMILLMNTCPWNFALADLDGDRDLDIATVHGTLVHVVGLQLNNGDGTFSEEVLIPTEYGARYLAVGDVDEDGDADLAIPLRDSRSGGERQLAIFFNRGDATFPDPAVYPLPDFPSPENIILVDLDADNDLDVAIANSRSPAQNGPDDHNFSVMFNDGRGDLGQRIDYIMPGTSGSGGLAAGDLDGDGDLDLAVAARNVSVFLNDGHGTFAAGVPYGTGNAPTELVTADFDGDGDLDVAAACLGSDNLTVIWNRACRRLAGDLNGDGMVDLDDYAFFYACVTGPKGGVVKGCTPADFDRDDDVDTRDYGALLPAWNPP